MIHVLHGSVYLHHTASTAQTIGGTDATVWEIRCALSHSTAETSSRLRQKSPQDLPTYLSGGKRRQLFVNVLYNLGVISVGIHIWVIHLHCPRDFREGIGKKGDFSPSPLVSGRSSLTTPGTPLLFARETAMKVGLGRMSRRAETVTSLSDLTASIQSSSLLASKSEWFNLVSAKIFIISLDPNLVAYLSPSLAASLS